MTDKRNHELTMRLAEIRGLMIELDKERNEIELGYRPSPSWSNPGEAVGSTAFGPFPD